MKSSYLSVVILSLMAPVGGTVVHAQDGCSGSATVGSGGSGATENTSASTLGTGGSCETEDGHSSTVGSGGSAAAVDGKVDSDTKVNANENNLNAKSTASAKEGGEWSRSKTQTKVRQGEDLSTRTKTMSHVPGSKPEKSTTAVQSQTQ
ncbi:hypothetical protein FHS85_005348 [Rhodoligotrophos appendicifer]|uniref:hypothetical protein n=2 Tax=Rhodoligotrophos appendicifer TaxID=987056 RepID=UPI003D1E2628